MTGGNPYLRLVSIAEREHAMVADGRYEELAGLAAERDALVATLPATAPAWARLALEHAAALQQATTAALEAALGDVRRQLGGAPRQAQAARAYSAVARSSPSGRAPHAAV